MEAKEFFRDLPTIQTERLILRALKETDVADMFAYASDEALCRYTTWEPHESIAVTRAFLAQVTSDYAAGKPANWGVVLRSSGKLVGTCGFCETASAHQRASLGYAIARPLWGQGYVSEAARAVIDCGFRSLTLHKIESHCDVRNVGSARVMEKCGMTHEGLLREHVLFKGEWRNAKLYGLLRSEWAATIPAPLTT